MDSSLHIQMLGHFHLVYGVTSITTLHTARLQSLLAYLVLHRNAPVMRQHLAFLLWPDSLEAQAFTNLRKFLFSLRHALPQADLFLHVDNQTIQWRDDAPFTLDVAQFEQAIAQATQAERMGDTAIARSALEQAVALYQGDLLPACYDDWIVPERERLQQMLLRAVAKLTTLLEELGEYRTAIAYAQPALRHDPLNEETYQTLMRLYALSGDLVGVLRTYQMCSAVLQRELGLVPSRATYEAYEQWSTTASSTQPTRPPQPALPPKRAYLPIQLTSFLGRERDLTAVKSMLAQSRLLTLTGPGGSGKSRLAHQAATDLIADERYIDGVWWVPLAHVADPGAVPDAVATVLGASELPGRTPMQLLIAYLNTKHGLLILDNCEHLIQACADLTVELLRTCPQLQILATSQEALNVGGEVIWPVVNLSVPDYHGGKPLSDLPDSDTLPDLSVLLQYESVRLFIERATGALSSFKLTHSNAQAIVEICQRLDGLPLAIELAAARVKVLSVEQIALRLDDRFRLLTGGSRSTLARHQTLQATIDWSYQLLSEPEQRLFRRLSVFAGTFTLEAAEQVCTGDGVVANQILDLLARLVDRSLITVDVGYNGIVGYHLLETIRHFGRDRLREAGEEDPLQRRHAEFYLTLAEEADPELRGPAQLQWLDRLESEFDNLRAALSWSFDREQSELALRLASALSYFCTLRSRVSEGRRWLAGALALAISTPSAPLRVVALTRAAELAFWQGDLTTGRSLAEEATAGGRALEEKRELPLALKMLGVICHRQGDQAAGHALVQESVRLARDCDDRWLLASTLASLGMLEVFQSDLAAAALHLEEANGLFLTLGDSFSQPLGFLGLIAQAQGDLERARALYEEGLAITRAIRARWLESYPLTALGDIARLQGQYERAHAYYTEALALYREQGEQRHTPALLHNLGYVALAQKQYAAARTLQAESLDMHKSQENPQGVAECVTGLAGVASAQGNPAQAARLLSAVAAWHELSAISMWPTEQLEYERQVAATRTRIDEQEFESAWLAGQMLTLDQAVLEALRITTELAV